MSKYKDLKEAYKYLEESFRIRDDDANFFSSYIHKQQKTIEELQRTISVKEKTIQDLHLLLDKATFKQTDFVYIKKRSDRDLVFYDLVVEYINPTKHTYNISTTSLVPKGIDINEEQPIINVLSTKSNNKYILIKLEISGKRAHTERTYIYDKQYNTTRYITPSEASIYKEL